MPINGIIKQQRIITLACKKIKPIYIEKKITPSTLKKVIGAKEFSLVEITVSEFKKEFGTTIIQYLLTKKITYAKELLRYSNSSIEEIAALCGISDQSYFNKIFRKLEGCTASEYRKKW